MIYLVMVLCHNEIHHCESFSSLVEAEIKAVYLANEWYRKDGIKAFGLDKISTFDEIGEYYGSVEYCNSDDAANIYMEQIELKDFPFL